MDVTADAVLLAADDKRNLGMRLQSDQTVNNMAARLLQHSCPDNVVLFIKPCLQLDQNRHLLAVVGRLCQCRNDRRVAADTVQRLLDGQNIGIHRSPCNEVNDRLKGLVRMTQENIPFSDLCKNITACRQLRNLLRRKIPVLMKIFKALHLPHLGEIGQIQRPVNPEHLLLVQSQLFLQNLNKSRIRSRLDFQPDGFSVSSLLQRFLDLLQKILCLILINVHIGITHDAERRRAYHVVALEKLSDVVTNDRLQKDHANRHMAVLLCPGADCRILRKPDQTGKNRRDLNGCKFKIFLLTLQRFSGFLRVRQNSSAGILLAL